MILLNLYIDILKNKKLFDEKNIRSKGLTLKKIRKLKFLEKIKNIEYEKKIKTIPIIYGKPNEGI